MDIEGRNEILFLGCERKSIVVRPRFIPYTGNGATAS
jgi:hypothetical protein